MTDQIRPLFTWRSAICASDLRPTVRHVALTLSLRMNELGDSAWPGYARLARETGLAKSTVIAALNELVELRWLGRERGGGRGRLTCYRAQIPETVRLTIEVEPSQPADQGGWEAAVIERSEARTLPGNGPADAPKLSGSARETVRLTAQGNTPGNSSGNTSSGGAARPGGRDLVFEAFCDVTNVDWRELSAARRAELAGMLRGAGGIGSRGAGDGTGAEIRRRAAQWTRDFTAPLTPETLVRRWAELGSARGVNPSREEAERDLAFAREHNLSPEAIAIYEERLEAAS